MESKFRSPGTFACWLEIPSCNPGVRSLWNLQSWLRFPTPFSAGSSTSSLQFLLFPRGPCSHFHPRALFIFLLTLDLIFISAPGAILISLSLHPQKWDQKHHSDKALVCDDFTEGLQRKAVYLKAPNSHLVNNWMPQLPSHFPFFTHLLSCVIKSIKVLSAPPSTLADDLPSLLSSCLLHPPDSVTISWSSHDITCFCCFHIKHSFPLGHTSLLKAVYPGIFRNDISLL